MTEVIRLNPTDPDPDPDTLAHAAAVLRSGGLVVYPTETVYGLAADALSLDAVQRVFDAKGRPAAQPLPVQIGQAADIDLLAQDIPAEARALIAAFFPGPLTLVLPRRAAVPNLVTGGGETVGLRMPNHPVALGVLRAFGGPLVCPSANITTHTAPMSAAEAQAELEGRVDLILDGGPTIDRTPSTVLDLTTRPARLLREGKLNRAALAVFVEIRTP